MELGLVLPQTGPTASPALLRDFALAAEESGIDRLWAVDHLVLPHRTTSKYVLGRRPTVVADGWLSDNLAPNYEMLTTLTWVAGFTSTIGLGTSVASLPLRNPVLNARQLATLDACSGGRLVCGVGIGWLREEAAAMGLPWDRRAARCEEHIAVLRTLWCSPSSYVEFHGEFFCFDPMDPRPRPKQQPIPILIGGHSPAALSRTVRIGDGWISAPMPTARLAELLDEIRRIADHHHRDHGTILKVASVSARTVGELGRAISEYCRLGVDQLQVVLPPLERDTVLAQVRQIAGMKI
ncbi:TIGR03619 family F420-dependent LLM class oxidoreductase [Mycolicibacterium sp. S3B2]|uniref:TIGR03619 family F420-dependent LLM class oxidoreductase n=1 Tax=Mycolicibacterium sp. S3B2 TaxID=3415120 RepID=UPI003C7B2B07